MLKISLKFVPNIQINNIPALVQIMAWRLPGEKPTSEPMFTDASLGLIELWISYSLLICKERL